MDGGNHTCSGGATSKRSVFPSRWFTSLLKRLRSRLRARGRDVGGGAGKKLAGVYLIGSLAHGGYSADHSDIDMALITESPPASADFDMVNGRSATCCPVLAAKVSLFGPTLVSAGRFPPLDRVDYLDHRIVLLEHRQVSPERPTLDEIRTYLKADPLRNWSSEVTRLSSLPDLAARDRKSYLRALLYPARFLYSWETGKVASNDDAVAYITERKLFGTEAELLTHALACRIADVDVAQLFSERGRLWDLLRICSDHVTTAEDAYAKGQTAT